MMIRSEQRGSGRTAMPRRGAFTLALAIMAASTVAVCAQGWPNSPPQGQSGGAAQPAPAQPAPAQAGWPAPAQPGGFGGGGAQPGGFGGGGGPPPGGFGG